MVLVLVRVPFFVLLRLSWGAPGFIYDQVPFGRVIEEHLHQVVMDIANVLENLLMVGSNSRISHPASRRIQFPPEKKEAREIVQSRLIWPERLNSPTSLSQKRKRRTTGGNQNNVILDIVRNAMAFIKIMWRNA
jgi:hypothetical protein